MQAKKTVKAAEVAEKKEPAAEEVTIKTVTNEKLLRAWGRQQIIVEQQRQILVELGDEIAARKLLE